MTETNHSHKARREIAYCAALFVLAVFIALVGIMLLHLKWEVITVARVVVPAVAAVYTLFLVLYLYLRKELRHLYDSLQCSRLKGCLLTYTVVGFNILVCCAVYGLYSPYAMPIAAVALILTVMLKERIGFVATTISALCVIFLILAHGNYYDDDPLNAHNLLGTLFGYVSAIFMMYLIWKRFSRFETTWGTLLLAIAITPLACLLAYAEFGNDTARVFEAAAISLLGNVIAVAIFTMAQPVMEIVFRMWSDFKLAEICSFDQPLLKRLREEAPGTFNHALTVANLVESCAIAIGLDPYMARACAYFHDIGKIKNPTFFVENQKDGYNPHDELIPELSAKIITRHTSVGAEMLRAARMPEQVVKAANEHHGDTPVIYFYLKAKGITEGELEINPFRYVGPRPTTKYSAIMMICDICEAMTRAKAPQTVEELEDIVGGVIRDKLTDGQFDDCELTIKDLHAIKMTICDVIPAILHKRIDYNRAKERR